MGNRNYELAIIHFLSHFFELKYLKMHHLPTFLPHRVVKSTRKKRIFLACQSLQLDSHTAHEPTSLLGNKSGTGTTDRIAPVQQIVDIKTKLKPVDRVVGTHVQNEIGVDIALDIEGLRIVQRCIDIFT